MSRATRIIKAVTPPVLIQLYKAVRPKSSKLFDGDGLLFEQLADKSRVYAEYGCGRSTIWMLRNSSARVISVESSEAWAERVRAEAGSEASRLDLHRIDIGRTGEWGRPIGFDGRDRFGGYILSPWRRGETPDLVLIDGRFRVACFFATLLHGVPGTHVLFDDYQERPHYAVAAEFLPPVGHCGRQAHFVVPAELDRGAAAHLLEKFEYVVD